MAPSLILLLIALLAPFTLAQVPAPAPVGTAPSSSYIAINCGGITPVNSSIPSYYGGVTYGAGPFYSPNNSLVSTSTASPGVIFAPDAFYSGESTKPLSYPGPVNASVQDAALYLTERYGLNFRYDFNLPNGNYTVFHYFSELQYNAVGARVFNVSIQGVVVAPLVDIFALAGANASLIVPVNTTVTNGLLTVAFSTVFASNTAGQAKVNALRIVPLTPPATAFSNTPPSSYRIDAGSNASYTSASGTVFASDAFYSGSSSVGSATVSNTTTDAPLYTTVRTGPAFAYYLNLPNGYYLVTLRFAEGQFTLPGQRLFSVAVQGNPAFPAVDIIANSTAGSPLTLRTTAVVANGQLRIQFAGLNGTAASVAAVEATPLVGGTNTTVAIDCGSPLDVIGGDGIIYQRDTFFAGGAALSTNPYQTFEPFNQQVDDFLYPTAREGNFTYNVSLPNGAYLVTHHFAELVATGPGQRIFDVVLQGATVLSQFDIFAMAGGNATAYKVQAPANVTNGFLTISFQTSPGALSLPNVTLSNYTLGGRNFTNALLPPLVNALLIQPGIPPPNATATAPAPAPGVTLATVPVPAPAVTAAAVAPVVAPAPAPAPVSATPNATLAAAPAPKAAGPSPPPPPRDPNAPPSPDPYFAYVATAADAPRAPLPPVPTFGGSAAANPSCPANGAAPKAIDCLAPCPAFTPPYTLNVAVNTGGGGYVSSCGVTFEEDFSDATRCTPSNQVPSGLRWCRSNIDGPQGGYLASTTEPIANTTDPTLFQSESIGWNFYYFTLPTPGSYYVSSYFAEVSGKDPVINVNRPNLRVFYIHYNLNPADSQGPIDTFADAGNQKFVPIPTVSRVVNCPTTTLVVEMSPTQARDAPKVNAIWVYGPVPANYDPATAGAPTGATPVTASAPTAAKTAAAPPS